MHAATAAADTARPCKRCSPCIVEVHRSCPVVRSRAVASGVLVLDFDGTMTDAEAEGRPFRDGYLEDLALLVGLAPDDPQVRGLADEVEAELAAAPSSHPFLWMGRPVAPATVDPYLRMVPIAHRILDHFGAIPSAKDRGRLLGS